MKTIVQVVQHLRPGGLEVMALELMKFSHHGHAMKIVSLEGDAKSALAAWPRLREFDNQLVFMNKAPGFTPSTVVSLKRLLTSLNADLIHTHHIGPYFYGGLAAFLSRIPHVHTEHDAWHYSNKRHQMLHRIVSIFGNPIRVADADVVAHALSSISGMNDIRVIKNGVDTAKYVPGEKTAARVAMKLPTHVKMVGASGRLEEVKGHGVLISAMAELPSHIHLAIAGSGSMEMQLKDKAKSLNLSDRIHFLGHVENMPQFYQSLDLFCLPSFNEGFPLAPLEAQACGIPTAVTNVGGAVETLCPESGLILKAGDANDMAEKIITRIHGVKSSNPRAFISKHADVRTMAHAYDSLAEGL
ncbi:glycosyl transferase [Enterovibrio norvegicus FF-162]|uniref:glycosyltransferase n=1 Tax=Enterovibrio norvegicus TaxID=188144 RepID=UPI000368A33E|nr:glycosyltransferase [Enterovibrio norvegicus]OEE86537.1 glycosyl transferase [Enterovibrio norvegicus FF-162]